MTLPVSQDKTLDQIALEALLQFGVGNRLDINRKYAKIFGIPITKWYEAPKHYRAIMILVLKKVSKEEVQFVTSGKDLNTIAKWIIAESTNEKVVKHFKGALDE